MDSPYGSSRASFLRLSFFAVNALSGGFRKVHLGKMDSLLIVEGAQFRKVWVFFIQRVSHVLMLEHKKLSAAVKPLRERMVGGFNMLRNKS